jgi:hypothetical protein
MNGPPFVVQPVTQRANTVLIDSERKQTRLFTWFYFGVNKGIENMPYLKDLGRQINRRLLKVERVSQNCGLSAESIQRVVQPTVTQDGSPSAGFEVWRSAGDGVDALPVGLRLPIRGDWPTSAEV